MSETNDQLVADEVPTRRPWVVFLLCLIPVWLLVSGGLGLWGNFRSQKAEEKKEAARFASVVSAPSMADDFHKLAVVIGARSSSVEEGRGLIRAASWIEGILGPSNTGYAVGKFGGPETGGLPILRIDLQGGNDKAAPLWVVGAYDSPTAESDVADASSGIVSMIAAAQALAGEKPVRPVRFVFLPHGYEASELVSSTEARFAKMVAEEGPADAILCLGSMRQGPSLRINTSLSANPALAALGSLGVVQPMNQANETLGTRLVSKGLPAIGIATDRSSETAAGASEAEVLSASTGRLVELIRRLMIRK